MATSAAQINTSTDSFGTWIIKYNAIANIISTVAVTVDSSNTGAVTTGNAYVNGVFTAVTLNSNSFSTNTGNIVNGSINNLTGNVATINTGNFSSLTVSNLTVTTNAVFNNPVTYNNVANFSANLVFVGPQQIQWSNNTLAIYADTNVANPNGLAFKTGAANASVYTTLSQTGVLTLAGGVIVPNVNTTNITASLITVNTANVVDLTGTSANVTTVTSTTTNTTNLNTSNLAASNTINGAGGAYLKGDSNGNQLLLQSGNTAIMLRNDGTNFYLGANTTSNTGTFSNPQDWPLYFNLTAGNVTIDAGGKGTVFGGTVNCSSANVRGVVRFNNVSNTSPGIYQDTTGSGPSGPGDVVVNHQNAAGNNNYYSIFGNDGGFVSANYITATGDLRLNSQWIRPTANLGAGMQLTTNGSLYLPGGESYSTGGGYGYVAYENAGIITSAVTATFSIKADNRILCSELDANSDQRLKNNITNITPLEGLTFIQNVHPVTWTWKEGSGNSGKSSGYVAQNVLKKNFNHIVASINNDKIEEYIDEEGFKSPAGEQLTLNYNATIPYLHAALLKAFEEIDNLKAEIIKLKGN